MSDTVVIVCFLLAIAVSLRIGWLLCVTKVDKALDKVAEQDLVAIRNIEDEAQKKSMMALYEPWAEVTRAIIMGAIK